MSQTIKTSCAALPVRDVLHACRASLAHLERLRAAACADIIEEHRWERRLFGPDRRRDDREAEAVARRMNHQLEMIERARYRDQIETVQRLKKLAESCPKATMLVSSQDFTAIAGQFERSLPVAAGHA